MDVNTLLESFFAARIVGIYQTFFHALVQKI